MADLSPDKAMLQEVLAESVAPGRLREIVDWVKGRYRVLDTDNHALAVDVINLEVGNL